MDLRFYLSVCFWTHLACIILFDNGTWPIARGDSMISAYRVLPAII